MVPTFFRVTDIRPLHSVRIYLIHSENTYMTVIWIVSLKYPVVITAVSGQFNRIKAHTSINWFEDENLGDMYRNPYYITINQITTWLSHIQHYHFVGLVPNCRICIFSSIFRFLYILKELKKFYLTMLKLKFNSQH